ncbi:hypothetical protein [Sphaerothrix gracilis]|uniref:hypothetical protein n=1 Tax=Sphaerothrix gracilis TaxID=3151835 RepID=UPI0031FCDE32
MTWPALLAPLAQTPTPTPPDVELLIQQLEFMKWMNTAFLAFLGFLGGLLTWFFKSNLEDAREMARKIVHQELTNQIQPLIKAESSQIQRTLRIEQIISNTVVDYYLPAASEPPREYQLLKGRGFLDLRYWQQNQLPQGRFGSVLVIDFVNSGILEVPGLLDNDDAVRKAAYQQREQIVNNTVHQVVALRIGNPVLVLYVRPGSGRIWAIDQLTTTFPEVQYYSSANTPVALMGAVVDSAYVAYGDRL